MNAFTLTSRPGPQREVNWFKQYPCSASQVQHVRATTKTPRSIYCGKNRRDLKVSAGESTFDNVAFCKQSKFRKLLFCFFEQRYSFKTKTFILNSHSQLYRDQAIDKRHNNKHHSFSIETDMVTREKTQA